MNQAASGRRDQRRVKRVMASTFEHVFLPIAIRDIKFNNLVRKAPDLVAATTSDGQSPRQIIDFLMPYGRGLRDRCDG